MKILPERRKSRANVEATMHEFSFRMTNGKLRVPGAFKAELFAYLTTIAINFGKIFRYKVRKSILTGVHMLAFG